MFYVDLVQESRLLIVINLEDYQYSICSISVRINVYVNDILTRDAAAFLSNACFCLQILRNY